MNEIMNLFFERQGFEVSIAVGAKGWIPYNMCDMSMLLKYMR